MNKYIFFTGAPGSRWSGVSQVFRDNWTNIDNTDLTPEKTYKHHLYSGHIGNYYGPGMLYSDWLDTEFGSREQWETEIAASYNGDNPVKLIMSHHFAYWLDEFVEVFPDSPMVLCYRTDQECFDWWHEAGGWDISYPNYTWYKDNNKMMQEIHKQNSAILEFAKRKNLQLTQPDVDFFRQHFDIDRDFIFDKDVKVAVYG